MIKEVFKRLLKRKKRYHLKSPSFLYHSCTPKNQSILGEKFIHNVYPENFKAQLISLKKKYKPVFIDEKFDRLRRGESIDGYVSISFDDGYKSVVEYALPILEELDFPATVFVNSKFINEVFWRDKVRFLINSELDIHFLDVIKRKVELSEKQKNMSFYKLSKDKSLLKGFNIINEIDQFLESNKIDLKAQLGNLYMESDDYRFYNHLKIGNHSYSHTSLSELSYKEQLSEIQITHDFLSLLNINGTSIFSLPFGGVESFNNDTIEILKLFNYNAFLLSSSYNYQDFNSRSLPSEIDRKDMLFGTRIMPHNFPYLDLK